MKNQSIFLAPDFNRRAMIAVLGICFLLFIYSAFNFAAPNFVVSEKILTDFDVFYLVGNMIWRSEFDMAYHALDFFGELAAFYGAESFMPWTYPPHFGAFMAPFALLPIGWAYALFVALPFAAYIKTVHLFSRDYFGVALFIIFPAIALNIKTGQNGFLTASLIGWFLLAFRKNSPIAGIPLGLMIMKPHLAATIGLITLLSRRISVILIAISIILASTLCVTLLFEPEIWNHFLICVKEASIFLKSGFYPLFRMTSLYATFHQLGLPPVIALSIQLVIAIAVCMTIIFSYFKCTNRRYFLAIVAMSTVWISPYSYDYDLAIWSLGICILVPDLVIRARQHELLILGLLCWTAMGSGILQNFLSPVTTISNRQQLQDLTYPLAAFAMIASQGLIIFLLKKQPAYQTAED